MYSEKLKTSQLDSVENQPTRYRMEHLTLDVTTFSENCDSLSTDFISTWYINEFQGFVIGSSRVKSDHLIVNLIL